jgi:hypothetical protein
MAELGDVVSSIGPSSQTVVFTLVWIFVAIFAVTGIGLLIWWGFKRKKWNLKVEIKLTRSDGKTTLGEWGKGFYDSKRGVVMIKRPGKGSRAIPMKIFDVRRYMQGPDLITVIQAGPEDYRPVLNDSWTEHVVEQPDEENPLLDEEGKHMKDEKGNLLYRMKTVKESILNIKTDTGENKAWRVAWEEAAKAAYTISSFLKQYQAPISIGIVVVCCFIGFAILWTKLSSVC